MTVKKIVNALQDAKVIRLGYNGTSHEFDPTNSLLMQAFGDYVVSQIYCDNHQYELSLAMRPVKEGEQ